MSSIKLLYKPRFDFRIESRFLFPGRRRLRLEAARADVRGDVTPRFGERSEAARRDGLYESVADDGGFSRPGQHGPLRGVGRRLVQVLVLTATADDLHAFDGLTRQGLDRAYD